MSSNYSAVVSLQEAIILASMSPRRQELLRQVGLPFRCARHTVDESRQKDEPAGDFAQRMAREKVRSVQQSLSANHEPVVLGADTVVVCDKQIMGKPQSRDEALQMLLKLSGNTHQVLSAVAVSRGPDMAISLSETAVEFRQISEVEICQYWDTGEPIDKAGAYAIQGLGGVFVKHIQGSYSGVVGLPLFETAALLSRFGVRCWQSTAGVMDRQS